MDRTFVASWTSTRPTPGPVHRSIHEHRNQEPPQGPRPARHHAGGRRRPVGSGAGFHAESASSVAVTSGTLLHANSRDGLTLTIDNLKPGDTRSGSLEITNTGSLDSALTLQETNDSSTFVAGDLKLTIADGSGVVYTGNFGDLDNAVKKTLANVPAGQKDTITFTVSMPTTADNGSQGKAASASYQLVTTPINDKSSLGWL